MPFVHTTIAGGFARIVRSVPDAIGTAESLYLRRLLQDGDAFEGLSAFLEKRSPVWRS